MLSSRFVSRRFDFGCGVAPKTIRVGKGPEFIARSLDLRPYSNGVELDFSRQGKPTDIEFIESFNGKFREAC